MASNYTKCKKCNKLVGHVDGKKICGCEPMSKKKIEMKDIPIREVLEYQKKWTENNKKSGGMIREPDKDYIENMPFCYEALSYPEKVVYRVMEKLADENYLEYGVSLRTAWLTEKGEILLARLNEEGEK